MKSEQPDSSAPPEPPEDEAPPERLSWAAYFGAATGLGLGMLLVMLGSAGVYYLDPDSDWADIVWQIASPLVALGGVISLGFAFHRWLRGQILLPAMFFLTVLVLGAWLALGPLGFPWMVAP